MSPRRFRAAGASTGTCAGACASWRVPPTSTSPPPSRPRPPPAGQASARCSRCGPTWPPWRLRSMRPADGGRRATGAQPALIGREQIGGSPPTRPVMAASGLTGAYALSRYGGGAQAGRVFWSSVGLNQLMLALGNGREAPAAERGGCRISGAWPACRS
jgi:hypothetical protein